MEFRVCRMIEIAHMKLELDTELMLLLKAHEREVNALSARRGLALLVGGGTAGLDAGALTEHAQDDLDRIVTG
jgi:hypothetical protein